MLPTGDYSVGFAHFRFFDCKLGYLTSDIFHNKEKKLAHLTA